MAISKTVLHNVSGVGISRSVQKHRRKLLTIFGKVNFSVTSHTKIHLTINTLHVNSIISMAQYHDIN